MREASGLPVGLYCQGAGGVALAAALEAVRAGADLIATAALPARAHAPPRLRRVGRPRARPGSTSTRASTSTRSGGPPTSSTSTSATSRSRRSRRASRHAPPSTACRPGSSPRSTCICASERGRRPDRRGARRAGRGSGARPAGRRSPRRSGRSSPRRRSINVLSAARYQTVVDELRGLLAGRFGSPPAAIDETVLRAVRLVTGESRRRAEVDLDDVRERPRASRRARRSCCCWRCSARRPSRSCTRSAVAAAGTTSDLAAARAEPGRADPGDRPHRPGVGRQTR